MGAVTGTEHRANLSGTAQRYLDRLSLGVGDLFHHVLATLHDPGYREANAGALRMEWQRKGACWPRCARKPQEGKERRPAAAPSPKAITSIS